MGSGLGLGLGLGLAYLQLPSSTSAAESQLRAMDCGQPWGQYGVSMGSV